MRERRSRAVGALLGLAVGDALGWPSLFNATYQLPMTRRRRRRLLEAQAEETGAIRLPVPYTHSAPSHLLHVGPTDDAEWAAFTARLLLKTGGRLEAESLVEAWRGLPEGVKGSFSLQGARANLQRGLIPPATGNDHPHYFDDAACSRAVAVGIARAGDPVRAAELAGLEASVTNSEDGLWGAQAIAAAIAAACGGAGVSEVIEAAVAQLPPDSWIGRTVNEALSLPAMDSPFALVPVLSDRIVSPIYSYGVAAPETVAVTLALVRATAGDLERAAPLAATIVRTADSVPALVGALCGALGGEASVPASWRERCRRLRGICVADLAGVDLVDLAERLALLQG